MEATTGGGSILIGGTKGNVKANTGGGWIDIRQAEGTVEVDTGGGSIKAEGSGPLKVNTGGGNITIAGARGYIEADTGGGSIEAELAISAKDADTHCTLKTGGGDITLSLPDKLGADIRADLEVTDRAKRDYRIYSDFPLTIKGEGTGQITAQGQINGGGDPILLHATDGDIRIKRQGEIGG